ncbi:MAG TPA: hypothetical protein VFY54_17210, partial [Rubrobacter sp.]|nr:hypothetical protein [Rubrobacter sp.]
QSREERWNFSQEEMARHIREKRLDPENENYPGLRTYARWESETEAKDYLPPTLEKLQEIARIMGFEADDLLMPSSTTPSQFVIARRLDELVKSQEEGTRAASRIVPLLEETNRLLRSIEEKLVG